MVAPRVGLEGRSFGHRPLRSDELATLRPLNLGLDAAGDATTASASIVLIERLMHDDRSALLLAYCQLNRDELVGRLDRLRAELSLPFRAEPLAAEVLAQTLDAARSRGGGADREYRSIPRRCRRVLRAIVEECVGFVPASRLEQHADPLATALAEQIELPDDLLEIAKHEFDAASATVVAAQTLLQFPRHDRAHLLQAGAPHREATAGAASRCVAQLLSRAAALDRFRVEIDRASSWMKACTAHTHLVSGRSRA
jgi:hypothetical protein